MHDDNVTRSSRTPLVSIGVPVYNEDAHLISALDSLVGQDYDNLELVISDNGSSDGTQRICEKYAEQHPAIRYFRFAENLGSAANSNAVIDHASGEYFLRASGHDKWSENYVSTCVAALEENPRAVVAFGSTRWIDESGSPYPKDTGWTDTRGMSNLERFFTQLWGNMHPIMGVTRTAALRRSLPFIRMAAADLALLLELSLMGDFIHVPDATWYRRESHGPQTYRARMRRYRSAEVGLIRSPFDALAPYGRLLARIARIIVRSKVTLREKLILLGLVFPTAMGRYAAARDRQRAAFEREMDFRGPAVQDS